MSKEIIEIESVKNLPTELPQDLEKAIEVLANFEYYSLGHPFFFLVKGQSKLDGLWETFYRNTWHFQNPPTRSKTPLEACQKMFDFLKTTEFKEKPDYLGTTENQSNEGK